MDENYREQGFVIEDASKEHAEELLAIYAPYVEETAISFEYEAPSLEEFAGRIVEFTKDYPYIKAVCDGKIIGYAYAHKFHPRKAFERCVETTVYVDREFKRGGIGRALYEELEKRLKKIGVTNMNAAIAMPTDEMMTKGGDDHLTEDSYKFHKRMGFDLVGRFHKCGYKFDRWYDLIWMEKIIGEHKDRE